MVMWDEDNRNGLMTVWVKKSIETNSDFATVKVGVCYY